VQHDERRAPDGEDQVVTVAFGALGGEGAEDALGGGLGAGLDVSHAPGGPELLGHGPLVSRGYSSSQLPSSAGRCFLAPLPFFFLSPPSPESFARMTSPSVAPPVVPCA